MLLAFFVAASGIAGAQVSTKTQPPVPPVTQRIPVRIGSRNTSGIPAEKSIKVDSRANVWLCVDSGNVKVSGWDRNEVRAMIEQGSYVGFKVLNKTAQNTPAVVRIVGYDTQKTTVGVNECLRGENIEIDVPRGASVKIEGRRSDAEISSVYKAEVKNEGGGMYLNDIAQGIEARTYQGDVRVENSGGVMNLSTTNGDIFVYNAKPIEFSNTFFARTISGAINLQAVQYSQTTSKTNSGKINFTGDILGGGQYVFDSQNGSIQLNISQKSSFTVTAVYGYGNFQTDIPLSNVVKAPGEVRKLTGQKGTGDAVITLSTVVGSISIKTKEP